MIPSKSTWRSRIGRADSELGLIAVSGAVVGWGFTGILVKLMALEGLAVTFYRLWLGVLMVAVPFLIRNRGIRPSETISMLKATVLPGALFGINIALFFSSLKETTVANAQLIGNLQPVLVLAVAGPIFGEKVGKGEFAWTLTSVLGVALVVFGATGIPEWSPFGDFLAFLAMVLWTAFFLVSKRRRAHIGTVNYIAGVLLFAAIVVSPLAVAFGQSMSPPHGIDWLWMILLVLIGTGGHLLAAWAHRHVDVSRSSVMTLGVPVISAVAALIILGETLKPLQIAGGLIVLVGVAAALGRTARIVDEPEPVA